VKPALSGKSFYWWHWTKQMSLYSQYEAEKARWLRNHPDATPIQIQIAFEAIARRLGL